MSLLNPIGLLLLLSIPAIVMLHLFRQERRRREVSSLHLWREVAGRRGPSSRPRLVRDPNLLLQLAAALLASLALAHPVARTVSIPAASTMVLILDDSASMQTGQGVSRMELARNRAREIIGRAPRTTRVMLVTGGPRPRIVQTFTDDRGLLYERIRDIRATDGAPELAAALAIADGFAAGTETDLILITDGAISPSSLPDLPANLRIELVGEIAAPPNRAVTAFELRTRPDGTAVEALIGIANHDRTPSDVTLLLAVDGRRVSEQRVALSAGEETTIAAEMPLLRGAIYTAELAGNTDALALDDRAYAVAAGQRALRVQLVSPGNVFLESLLSVFPNVDLTISPAPRRDAPTDLLVLDRVPAPSGLRGSVIAIGTTLPDGPFLPLDVVRPGRPTGRPDHPVTRGVRFDDVRIAEAMTGDLDPRASVAASSGEHPLIYSYRDADLSLVGFTFGLGQTDLALRAGFPVLMHNAVEWLAPVAPVGEIGYARVGSTVLLYVPPGEQIVVTGPDGTTHRAVPRVSPYAFDRTYQVGIYEVEGASFRDRFAVTLADSQASNLVRRLEAVAPSTAAPGAERTAGVPLWPWMALAALLLLVADWVVWTRRH